MYRCFQFVQRFGEWRQLLTVLLLVTVGTGEGAHAQAISGRTYDATTGEPLPGVTVLLRGSQKGTTSDRGGNFYLDHLEPGLSLFVARTVGYQEVERFATIEAYRTDTLSFYLVPDVVELDQVEVVASRLGSQRDTQPSLFSLDPQSVRQLPGAGEDVMRALQATPGVMATSDFSSQMVVRGGSPDENLIVIDGVEVFNPYRLYGVVSMFNPATVSDVKLLTGGFPTSYGDRLSSVLDVITRDGSTERLVAGSLNASVTNANLVLEGRTGRMDGSWLISGRRTYYDLLLGLVARRLDFLGDDVSFPNFADVQSKLVLRPARGHRLQAGLIASRDAMDVSLDGEELTGSSYNSMSADDRTRNEVAYAAWHWVPAERVLAKLTASWYQNGGTMGSDGQFIPRDHFDGNQYVLSDDTLSLFEFAYDQRFRFRKASIRQEVAHERGAHLFEAGIGLDQLETKLYYDLQLNEVGRAYWESIQNNNPTGMGAVPEFFDQARRYLRFSAYAQDRLRLLGGRLFVQPGVRYDHYGVIGKDYLSPRVNFSFAVNPLTTLRGAWGVYHQSPGFEKMVDRVRVYDLSEGGGIERLQAERAMHFILGVSRWLDDRWRLRVEGYHKKLDNLIVQERKVISRYVADYKGIGSRTDPAAYEIHRIDAPALSTTPVNDAYGTSSGIELLLEKKYLGRHDHVSGWASYTLARAGRTRTNVPGGDVHTPFEYDRRHVVNALFEYRIDERWRLGFTFRYGTGFPYTPAVGYSPLVVARTNPEKPQDPPTYEILVNHASKTVRFEMLYGDERNLNSARTPDYHRLDVRLSRTWTIRGVQGNAYLDVINVYNRRNVLSYNYQVAIDSRHPEDAPTMRRQQTSMLPLLPTLGLNMSF